MPTIYDRESDEYSDDSFRSDVSEDELKVSAPPTPSSRGGSPSHRPRSGKGKRSARQEKPPSPYLGSAGSRKPKGKSGRPGSATAPGLKTAREYWLDDLKSGKGGLTGCSKSSNYLGAPKKTQAFSSTSDYLREKVLDMPPRKSSKNRPVVSDPVHRNMKGVPSYKPQEEMYDDILDLKKQINALKSENDLVKAKNKRLEDDNVKKDRQIDQLLDPSKSDLRMTLNSRQPDSAAKVNSLKQRNLKLEMNLKDKETELMKLKNDMKGTRMEEMKVAMDSFYQEVQRLRYQLTHSTGRPVKAGVSDRGDSNAAAKVKALNGTILRLTGSNQRLQSENKLLQQDLERTLQVNNDFNDGDARSDKSRRDFEDMNRRELLSTLANLQRKVDQLEAKGYRKDRHKDGDVPGKIPLTGTLSDRLDQLDKRETELLQEKARLEKDVSRLREDKARFRQKVEQMEDENKALQKEVSALREQQKSMTPRGQNGNLKRHPSSESIHSRRSERQSDRHETDRLSERSDKRSRTSSSASLRRKQREEEEREREREREREERKRERERDRKLEEIRQKQSARTLQKNWRAHKQREQDRDSDLEEAATTIQAATRGHHRRKDLLDRFQAEPFSPSTTDAASERAREEEDSDIEDAAVTIQSAVKGHLSRKEQLNRFNNRSDSEPESARSYRSGKSSKAGSTKSGLDRFMSGSRPSSSKGGSSRAGSVHNGSASKKQQDSDEDSDDSLVMSTTSKRSSLSKQSNRSAGKGRQGPQERFKEANAAREEESDSDDGAIVF